MFDSDFIFGVIVKNKIFFNIPKISFLNRFFVLNFLLHFDPKIVVYFKYIPQKFRFTHKVFHSLKAAD